MLALKRWASWTKGVYPRSQFFYCTKKLKTDLKDEKTSLNTQSPETTEASKSDKVTSPFEDGKTKCTAEPQILNGKGKGCTWGFCIFFASLVSSIVWAVYELGKPELDRHGAPIEDDLIELPLPQQYIRRVWNSLAYYKMMLPEPQNHKLLPNPAQPPYIQPRYSLVLELKDVLVHPDWTYQTGWRFKKRPGVDYFLQQCSKHFEIIVYTAEQGMTVFPILDALDPNGYIRYRLVRGSTQLLEGHHVKNLSRLNRNLKRVILVDWDRNALCLHPDNNFALTRWLGNDDDVQLFDLAAFLNLIAENEVDDVREVLHYYRQFEDPIQHFKENQRKLLEQKQEKSELQSTAEQSTIKHRTYSFMGSLVR